MNLRNKYLPFFLCISILTAGDRSEGKGVPTREAAYIVSQELLNTGRKTKKHKTIIL